MQLNPKGTTAVNIAQSIEQLIRNQHWPPGFRLPTVRALAEELGVNPNTISAAYKQLRNAGIIATDGRRGSFVPEKTAAWQTMALPTGLIDLASGNVDRNLLPSINPAHISGYNLATDVGSHGDSPALIAFIQHWLQQHCHTSAEPYLFFGSLDIIERALTQRCLPGAKVLIEDPCWPPAIALLNHLRLQAVPLAMDAEGAKIPAPAVLDNASAVILTARAHSPTGICYSRTRWQQWQQALDNRNILLIIDDHWGALSRMPFHGMQSFTNEWIYSTSTSKFLGTDFRIAVAAGNSPILPAMKTRFTLGPRWISKLLQHLALNIWQSLDSDGLNRIAESYAHRRRLLLDALAAHHIRLPYHPEHGEGMHIWLPVPNEAHIIQALAAKGWAVQSGAPISLSRQPAIRITVSNLSTEDCQPLADDIAEALGSSGRAIY
ncbi:aminotransferase class I/II-fold pyridoxal phosphate-dependent enzyme [Uruburuella testudinis]|uniref:Putative 8-amino-7-oxononanoate synthase n=1 Tax=Uruburuella testudinis TaxID=1282863 RepID=A0ABY4DVK6_9NEIS|nr:aminotransferase class I/II-fold pyridoxal phosphate-dependent enzyme [Uruburuella testudinis]UOO83073.1 aminotransferase class I/II-fold pyridoxal phosphate-dependent enzyme [Uruburuella testudinis]